MGIKPSEHFWPRFSARLTSREWYLDNFSSESLHGSKNRFSKSPGNEKRRGETPKNTLWLWKHLQDWSDRNLFSTRNFSRHFSVNQHASGDAIHFLRNLRLQALNSFLEWSLPKKIWRIRTKIKRNRLHGGHGKTALSNRMSFRVQKGSLRHFLLLRNIIIVPPHAWYSCKTLFSLQRFRINRLHAVLSSLLTWVDDVTYFLMTSVPPSTSVTPQTHVPEIERAA